MLSCCFGLKDNEDSLSEKDEVPKLVEIDIELGYKIPSINASINEWENYYRRKYDCDKEKILSTIVKLNSLAKKNLLINKIAQLLYNYKNNKDIIKRNHKRERIKREILALKEMRKQIYR